MTSPLATAEPSAGELKKAAMRSVEISPDENGKRPRDPLRHLIPGDADTSWHVLWTVEQITGDTAHHRPPVGKAAHTAPSSRAALRRWALQNGGKA
jgi:hypothetical protein